MTTESKHNTNIYITTKSKYFTNIYITTAQSKYHTIIYHHREQMSFKFSSMFCSCLILASSALNYIVW